MDTHGNKGLGNPVGVFQLTNTLDIKWLTASLVATAQTEGNAKEKNVNVNRHYSIKNLHD